MEFLIIWSVLFIISQFVIPRCAYCGSVSTLKNKLLKEKVCCDCGFREKSE